MYRRRSIIQLKSMKAVTEEQIRDLCRQGNYNKRLVAELRMGVLASTDWLNLDFFTLADKSQRKGLLFYELDGRLTATAYAITPKHPRRDGRNMPVICDICKTWRRGGATGLLTMPVATDKRRTIGCYTCLDLQCSLHARDLTPQALVSRTQLREDMEPEARIARLNRNLQSILKKAQVDNQVEALSSPEAKRDSRGSTEDCME